MEYNVFRDYCKAENSEDEDVNHDLQSQLYSGVYYTLHDKENVNTKTNIKSETSNSDDEKLHKNANTSKTPNSTDSFIKSSYDNNCTKMHPISDLIDNLIEKDDKPDIKNICVISTTELLHNDVSNKGNSNVSCTKILEHTEESHELPKVNKQLTMCYNVECAKSSSNCHCVHNTEKDVCIKSETEVESKDEVKILHCSDELNANQSSHLNSAKDNIDNNDEKVQEVISNEVNTDDSSGNILKKYEFSKLFINKLYLEKYENLMKRLQIIEEKENQEVTNVKRGTKNNSQQGTDKQKQSVKNVETNRKYICYEIDQMQRTTDYSDEITILSDTESDSAESILEVPIPPKPQPPIINLQDSDESLDRLCSDSDDQESSFHKQKENILSRNIKENTTIDLDSDSSTLNFGDNTVVSENIMLNCTEIRKGASSIKEVLETSKTAQTEQSPETFSNKLITENEVPNESLSNFNQLLSSTNNKDSTSEFQLPSKTFNNSNVAYDRDKKKSVNFAEDVIISNVDKLSPNRKRHHEIDDEPCTSAKQRKETSNIERKCSKTISGKDNDKNKNNQESWEEYFFRPMSENIKAFYNESRGQENYDIHEVQSKMSKDPRLWTILHDDLMPNLLKHRYWNMKCSYCHKHGHQTHNCPEPYKPLRCHMCGTQGHTETRCPQKMCLTCGKKQRIFRKTCESCRMLYCNMCKAVGHKSTECPDLWRRFHQTTQTTEVNIPESLSEVMKPANLLYCCNCTKQGHDSSTCNEYRWSQHFPTPAFVSSYTDGPEYGVSGHKDTTEDIIPLSTAKIYNPQKRKNMVFSKDNDDLENCCVIYSYGSFYTKKPIGEEIKRKLSPNQASDMMNALKGCIFPSFLDQLIRIAAFEIKIYYNANKELIIRVRSAPKFGTSILELFVYWLKLENEDKHLSMFINLPHNSKKLVKLLRSKLVELQQILPDPKSLCNQIEQLKTSRINFQDPTTSAATSDKILDLRSKLMKVFHTKPKHSVILKKLKKYIRKLSKEPCDEINTSHYLDIILNYNKVFLPRSLTNSERQRLFKAYYKEIITQKNKEKDNETKKQKKIKRLSKAYEMFIQNLQKINKSTPTAKARKNTDCNEITAANAEKQDEQVTTTTSTSTESTSVSSNVQSNKQTATHNVENISAEIHIVEHNVAESIYPTECTQLLGNQSVSSNNKETNTTNLKNISSNLISVPSPEFVCTNTSLKQTKNDHVNSVSCTKVKTSESNIEKHIETLNSNNGEVRSNEQEKNIAVESEASVSKRKKSKKTKKAKLDIESNLDGTEILVTNINTSAEIKANEIMNEALEFNLPYMNKAVEEVRKRINSKSLKQEHIDTLQRLINLEKDHRKYVSSFCNYLQ